MSCEACMFTGIMAGITVLAVGVLIAGMWLIRVGYRMGRRSVLEQVREPNDGR